MLLLDLDRTTVIQMNNICTNEVIRMQRNEMYAISTRSVILFGFRRERLSGRVKGWERGMWWMRLGT